MLIVMGLAAWLRFGSATHFGGGALLPALDFKNVFFWSTVAFAFGGVESASAMGDEIQNPRRNIPRALLASGIIVTVVYVLATFGVLTALPAKSVSGLQGFMQAISKVASKIGIDQVAPFVALLVTVSSIGGVTAPGSRPRRGFRSLPAWTSFFRQHSVASIPGGERPTLRLAVQALLAAIFIFLGQAGTSVRGAYDFLVGMGIISTFVPFVYLFCSVIRLQREPAGPEVFRIPGGKPMVISLAILGLTTTIISSILACIPPEDEPNKAMAVIKLLGSSGCLIAIGAIVYWLGTRRSPAAFRKFLSSKFQGCTMLIRPGDDCIGGKLSDG
jgi:amino acid transporter